MVAAVDVADTAQLECGAWLSAFREPRPAGRSSSGRATASPAGGGSAVPVAGAGATACCSPYLPAPGRFRKTNVQTLLCGIRAVDVRLDGSWSPQGWTVFQIPSTPDMGAQLPVSPERRRVPSAARRMGARHTHVIRGDISLLRPVQQHPRRRQPRQHWACASAADELSISVHGAVDAAAVEKIPDGPELAAPLHTCTV